MQHRNARWKGWFQANRTQRKKGLSSPLLAPLLFLVMSVLAVGCQNLAVQKTPAASTASPALTKQERIDRILELSSKGKLSDDIAAKLLSDLAVSGAATSAAQASPPVPAAPAPAKVLDSPFPAYRLEYVVSGRLRSVGSDTMDKLMALWEEGFRQHHPGIRLYHQGKGSSTAPPALIEGMSDFGPMSRKIKDKEVAQFKEKFGYEPTQFRVAIDALAVYVHPSNPLARNGMDFQQLDAIFGSERKRGLANDCRTWGDLGLTGEWANAPIHVYSRNTASGTYAFFQKTVMKKGAYKSTNRMLAGSSLLVEAVSKDKFGIGYSGIGYKTDGVATVPLAEAPGGKPFPAEGKYAYSGEYPLARFLYLTINNSPGGQVAPLHREFMSFVYSDEGQNLVTKDGFFGVSPEIATEELAKLGLTFARR